jgi:ribosomal protein S18 acetylase RimI-like enzyme
MTQNISPGPPAGSQTSHQSAAMGTIGPEIAAFTQAHWRTAVATLVDAFVEDPVAAHLFPDPLKRPAGMAHIFRMGLRYGQAYGRVDVVKSADAVAVWIRPEYNTPSWIRMVRAGILASPFSLGWSATRRMLRFEHFIAACRMRTVDGPHWFLFCIGVRPDQQGQGLGVSLIRHGLKHVRATDVPCYLETANPCNLPFYQKNGFRLVGGQHQPSDGPVVWSLVAGSDQ